jgi:4-hydroxybenzoate polyprenyltransferase
MYYQAMKKLLNDWRGSPYIRLMRLHKPVGFLLTLLPCLWTIIFAIRDWSQLWLPLVVCLIGAPLVRGIGCILNDIIDCEIDRQVERTKTRPIAAGEITRTQALIFAALLCIPVTALLLLLPWKALIASGITTLLIIIYPFAKRVTPYPQIVLGFAFNLGVIIVWYIIYPYLGFVPLLIYAAAVLWSIGFDTIYGFQDIEDDRKIGIHSTSITWGETAPKKIWYMYQAVIVLLMVAALNSHMALIFYLVTVGAAYLLFWQSNDLDISSPKDCARKFNASIWFGILILIAAVLGRIF